MRRLPSLVVLAASVLARSAALPVTTPAGAQVSRVVWGRERVHLRGSLRRATATAAVSGLPAELGMNGPVQGRLLTASRSASRERHQSR